MFHICGCTCGGQSTALCPSISPLYFTTYNAEGFLVQIIIFILPNGNRFTSCCNVDRTLRSLWFTWRLGITTFNLSKELQRDLCHLYNLEIWVDFLFGFVLFGGGGGVPMNIGMYGCAWVYIYHTCGWICRGHKRVLELPDPQELELQRQCELLCGCRELNLVICKSKKLLTTKDFSSPIIRTSYLWCIARASK